MKYDIYFHDDFDGRASAAVLLNFFARRGDTIQHYFPVEHGMDWAAKKLSASSRRNPSIVVDFPYHPEAKFWFDHHQTTFLKEAWRRRFKATKFQQLDPKAPSACGLIVKSLRKHFGYAPPPHIKELARWLDIYDSASYISARQAIENKEPALKIGQFIDEAGGEDALIWLIELLSTMPLEAIANDPRIRKKTREIRKNNKKLLLFYREHLKIRNAVGFIDLSGQKSELRFAPYYLYPKIRYAVVLKKNTMNGFRLSVSANPWPRKLNRIHLGEFLRARYGGGGHRDAGGASFPAKQAAASAAEEVIGFLNLGVNNLTQRI